MFDDHRMIEDIDYVMAIKDNCHGVLLARRGVDDNHVVIIPITEDDDNWFTSSLGFSSYWLPRYIDVMNRAMKWINENCDKDESGYGWKFRQNS